MTTLPSPSPISSAFSFPASRLVTLTKYLSPPPETSAADLRTTYPIYHHLRAPLCIPPWRPPRLGIVAGGRFGADGSAEEEGSVATDSGRGYSVTVEVKLSLSLRQMDEPSSPTSVTSAWGSPTPADAGGSFETSSFTVTTWIGTFPPGPLLGLLSAIFATFPSLHTLGALDFFAYTQALNLGRKCWFLEQSKVPSEFSTGLIPVFGTPNTAYYRTSTRWN
ncbi:hypothetical protein M427DRAFT_75597 [Gonapodya prolifera JEL478]|uniref:Uncharacterized protein n=1 Tax=Gonapodya prolifera (strain JEL478) TaxID=1344416 RepID=A0A138ZYN9_GONPJ|nr:hypothetical protein M427DRAFT_75597 [Gonapodya prolifera JEL478]|eukprot:KXS09385.1 hypothetical protein M427DRAFT_75597 [Gonapodya prolifera JEL478]